MILTAKAEQVIEERREHVFDHLVSNAVYPRILRPLWPIPGIVSAEVCDADAPCKGAWRTVTLTNGNVIAEQILEFEAPQVHRYAWSEGLRMPLSLLIRLAEATWIFSELVNQTHVRWAYAFELNSPIAWPAAQLLIWRFESWMARGLRRARLDLESAAT